VPVSSEMRKAMILALASTLSPSRPADGNCVSGVFAKYCVSG
jgi:hypothetical protein